MIEIPLSNLKNSSLFTLCLRMHQLILAAKTPEMGIDLYFNRFDAAYQQYKIAMEKVVLSAAEIAQLDSFRDRMWSALRVHVKNYLRHPELGNVAQALLAILDKNGRRVTNQSYETETAILKNATDVLTADFQPQLEAIHATDWVNLLKQANTDFENAQRSFNAAQTSANEIEAASTLRPQLEDALRTLLTFLPLQAEVSGNAALASLVKELETEASRF